MNYDHANPIKFEVTINNKVIKIIKNIKLIYKSHLNYNELHI